MNEGDTVRQHHNACPPHTLTFESGITFNALAHRRRRHSSGSVSFTAAPGTYIYQAGGAGRRRQWDWLAP